MVDVCFESCEKVTTGFERLFQLMHFYLLPCFFLEEVIGEKKKKRLRILQDCLLVRRVRQVSGNVIENMLMWYSLVLFPKSKNDVHSLSGT